MRFRFVMGQVFKGLGHNFAMTVSVILVTCVSLLFVGTGILAQLQITQLKTQWYAKVEVNVYMCAKDDSAKNCNGVEATTQQVADVRERLSSSDLGPYVKQVYHLSKQDTYKDFMDLYGDTVIGEVTTVEMMPESFRIKLKDPNDYEIIASDLEGRPGVEMVQDQRAIVEPLLKALNNATLVSWGLAMLMVIAAILLITTTIRLSAMSREKETSIMRLVGASNLFVQLPFMIEGAIAALIGAVLAVGGIWLESTMFIQGWLAKAFPSIKFIGDLEVWIVSPILIVAAILLAMLASAVSLAKYAKV